MNGEKRSIEDMQQDNTKKWVGWMSNLKKVKEVKKEAEKEESSLKKQMQSYMEKRKVDALAGGGGYVTWYETAGALKLDEDALSEITLLHKGKCIHALNKMPKSQRDLAVALLEGCEIDLADFYVEGKGSRRFLSHFDKGEGEN